MKKNKNAILQMYFADKLRAVDIAEKLNISKSAVSQVLKKDDRYVTEKAKRIANNKKKHKIKTEKYIKTVRKIKQFQKNTDDQILKSMHNQASNELSKGKKLNDMAYRNWNKSAYTYNEKRKGFEFRKELGRSADVPKFIKVGV